MRLIFRKFSHVNSILRPKNVYCTSLLYLSDKNAELEKRRTQMMQRSLPKVKPIEDVKHIIMVASGKGGVGKSTTAVNLATALKATLPDKNIGLLDADIFGPSIPLMMNLHETPLVDRNKLMLPLNNYGVKCMSFGFLIEEGSPVIWRGLMVMQALEKLMRGVKWGYTDYLIIDTPPGTGDTHLSLIQNLPIDGVVLVTTPQSAALQVTKRGATMFQKLKIPLIGLVENMSSVECPNCSTKVPLFGSGTQKLADEVGIKILQKVPLESEICAGGDKGIPLIVAQPHGSAALSYQSLAKKVVNFINEANK